MNLLQMLADARPRRLEPDRVPDVPDLPVHVEQPRRRRPLLVLAAAGLAVVAAVAAGIAARPQPDRPAGHPQSSIRHPKEPNALLLAAEHMAAAPGTSGRYWHTKVVSAESRPLGKGYDVVIRNESDTWYAAGGGVVQAGRYLGASPADTQAWRADGSPERWQDGGVTIERSPSGPLPPRRFQAGLMLAGKAVTAADLAALPTDPAALRAELVRRYGAAALFDAAEQLVLALPAPPGVLAAAYRMLATVDGVTVAGAAADGNGRPGVAVEYTRRGDAGWNRLRLIVDPATGVALAEESWALGSGAAQLLSYRLVETAEWTDEAPPSA